MEKIYLVEFMKYTNFMKDTVSDLNKELGHGKYLTVGKEPFLVKESDLDKYRSYGNGFRYIKFIGNLKEDED